MWKYGVDQRYCFHLPVFFCAAAYVCYLLSVSFRSRLFFWAIACSDHTQDVVRKLNLLDEFRNNKLINFHKFDFDFQLDFSSSSYKSVETTKFYQIIEVCLVSSSLFWISYYFNLYRRWVKSDVVLVSS